MCDEAFDFSKSMSNEIYCWGLGVVLRKDRSRAATKAWNKFVNDEERLFIYLSPNRQIVPEDLPSKARASNAMHLICSPQQCEEILTCLIAEGNQCQLYVWKPIPNGFIPSQYEFLKSVMQRYHRSVLSPNSLESAVLAGLPEPTPKEGAEALDREHFQFVHCMIIRCGSMGSYLRTDKLKRWYPAHFANHPERVIDPTSAGNVFTGAILLALAKKYDWNTTLAMACVGVRFIIEQVGPPSYDPNSDTWNGQSGQEKIRSHLETLSRLILLCNFKN